MPGERAPSLKPAIGGENMDTSPNLILYKAKAPHQFQAIEESVYQDGPLDTTHVTKPTN